jgi:aminopeptidase
MKEFTPSKKILEKYADVLVNFALGSGDGIKKKEIVYVQFDAKALPLAVEVQKKILEQESYPMIRMHSEAFAKDFFNLAKNHQLEFFPEKYSKTLVDTIDHRMYLIAEEDPFLLKGIKPEKIMKASQSKIKMRKWLEEKEDHGKLTWTVGLYGTEGLAKEAGLSLKQFWSQIIKACYLDKPDPIKEWTQAYKLIESTRLKLNNLKIEKLHLTADKTDLWITMGEKRRWMGGSGRNIPSFELFTSPDWRGTEGYIHFDMPLYRYGNLVKNVRLEFNKGKVVKASATKNQKLLQEMIKQPNADRIGEYSLTDKRVSKINKFMANTLFDENFGGEFGNTHLAVGMSYHDCYDGDPKKVTEKQWEKMGFNSSMVHTDIIATKDRTVEAFLKGGKSKVIYKKGKFVI